MVASFNCLFSLLILMILNGIAAILSLKKKCRGSLGLQALDPDQHLFHSSGFPSTQVTNVASLAERTFEKDAPTKVGVAGESVGKSKRGRAILSVATGHASRLSRRKKNSPAFQANQPAHIHCRKRLFAMPSGCGKSPSQHKQFVS
jgi:hypothetical protein